MSNSTIKQVKEKNLLLAEQIYLGNFISNAEYVLENTKELFKDCFSNPVHQIIFSSILDIYNQKKQSDLFLLFDYIEKNELIPKNEFLSTKEYIQQLSKLEKADNIKVYAEYIWENYTEKKLQKAATEILKNVDSPNLSLKDKINFSHTLINEIDVLEEGRKIKDMVDVLKDSLDVLTKNISGDYQYTPTKFEDLDNIILGLDQPSYVVIGGRPAMGKTSFGMQVVENLAVQNKKVLVLSLEMPQEQLVLRMISSNARIPFNHIRDGKIAEVDFIKIQNAVAKLKNLNIKFDDDGSNTIADIEKKATSIKKQHGLDVLLIDYIQLIKSDNPKLAGKRSSEMEDISRRLMALGKKLNITVIVLAQLNRNVEERVDKRPIMADLRDTGGIEQDAHLIMFCYRDEYYNRENTDKKGQAEIIIRKARNGSVGTATLKFIPEYTRFEHYEPDEYDEDDYGNNF